MNQKFNYKYPKPFKSYLSEIYNIGFWTASNTKTKEYKDHWSKQDRESYDCGYQAGLDSLEAMGDY